MHTKSVPFFIVLGTYKFNPISTWYWRVGFRSDQKWGRYFSIRVISQFGDGLFQLRRVEVEVECRRYRQWFVRGGLFLDRGGWGRRGGPGGFQWAPASPAGSVGSCCHLSSGVPRGWRWLLTEKINNNHSLIWGLNRLESLGGRFNHCRYQKIVANVSK